MWLCCFPEQGIQLAKAPILCLSETKLHFHVNKIIKCDHNNCKILLHSIMLLCCFPEQGIQLVLVLHQGCSLNTNTKWLYNLLQDQNIPLCPLCKNTMSTLFKSAWCDACVCECVTPEMIIVYTWYQSINKIWLLTTSGLKCWAQINVTCVTVWLGYWLSWDNLYNGITAMSWNVWL